jgi:hypothetical protein
MQINNDSPASRMATPIKDGRVERVISNINSSQALAFLRDTNSVSIFVKTYHKWLLSSPNFQILGLEAFKPYMNEGVTSAFQDFYQIYRHLNIKIKKGEYAYHSKYLTTIGRDVSIADHDNLDSRDCLILSWPFSGNGSVAIDVKLLEICNEKNIPVFLDCAFWGLSIPCSIDLNRFSCIKMVSFSLSKYFNFGCGRIGLSFYRNNIKGSAWVLEPWGYANRWAAFAGVRLCQELPISYMFRHYRPIQQTLCKKMGLDLSDTLFFGLGDANWKEYERDGYNRVGLSAMMGGLK